MRLALLLDRPGARRGLVRGLLSGSLRGELEHFGRLAETAARRAEES